MTLKMSDQLYIKNSIKYDLVEFSKMMLKKYPEKFRPPPIDGSCIDESDKLIQIKYLDDIKDE
jgi:hypothetical protein